MANDFLKNMPPGLKALWQLENELRRALQSAVLLRREDAEKNLERARLHMQAALLAVKGEYPHVETSAADSEAAQPNAECDLKANSASKGKLSAGTKVLPSKSSAPRKASGLDGGAPRADHGSR